MFRSIALFVLAAVSSSLATAAGTSFKFQFGAKDAKPGCTLVPVSAVFSKEVGYGFEPGATLTAVPGGQGAVTSAQPFLFSVAVPEGNYRVTLTLGHPSAAAVTTVKAETRRLMVEKVSTAPGESVTRTIAVNVRGPKLADGSLVKLDSREMNVETQNPISRSWDDKLTIAIMGENAAVSAIEVERLEQGITLFITGDSTVTDQSSGGSWGQMITRWFKPAVAVANHAESGETFKGFLKERRWDKILESISPGDYVLIEFGTNDSKSSGPQNIYPGQDFSETFAPAETTFKELMRRFVADVRRRGAQPLISSPSARRGETTDATSLAAWAKAAMEVARELDVPAIDLNAMGVKLNQALGADADKQFADRTHHSEYGAYLQSKCIALSLKQGNLPLAKFIVDDFSFDPEHPEPLPAAFNLPADTARRAQPRPAPAPGAKE